MTMALPDTLTLMEDSIRRSVLADSFDETPALLDRYAKELERRLQAAPADLPAFQERARALFEWTSQLVLVSREEALASLRHLRTLSGYQGIQNSRSQVRTDA